MTAVEMYKKFRREIDGYCVPDILSVSKVKYAMADGKRIGMIVSRGGYIDCVYTTPKYRHMGCGTELVLEWYEENKNGEVTLHIVNSNAIAQVFWHSIFDLEVIEQNVVDTLYKVRGLNK